MARIRALTVFILAIAAGGTFAFATYRYTQQTPVSAQSLPTRAVIVATANLDLGAELQAEDVKIVEWPEAGVPAGAFSKPQEVIGRGLIQPLVANEPVLASKLAGQGEGAGLPPIIPDGMRALSVRVNDVVGVAGYVLPGTRVDVLATVNPSREETEVTSKVILTNVQVLAAGTKIERDDDNDKPIAVSVVTLLVAPAEAERLTLASTEGKIQLALRNPIDRTAPETPGIKPAALMGAAAAARPAAATRPAARRTAPTAPVAAAEPSPTVEMIRGAARAQEVVRQ